VIDKIYYIIDASVVAKLFFPEPLHKEAIIFFQNSIHNNYQLLAPSLIDYEFGNICWKKFYRGEIKAREAEKIINDFQQLPITRMNVIPILNIILDFSIKSETTFYDSSYLVLAIELKGQFVTADEKFFQKVQGYFPDFINILSEIGN